MKLHRSFQWTPTSSGQRAHLEHMQSTPLTPKPCRRSLSPKGPVAKVNVERPVSESEVTPRTSHTESQRLRTAEASSHVPVTPQWTPLATSSRKRAHFRHLQHQHKALQDIAAAESDRGEGERREGLSLAVTVSFDFHLSVLPLSFVRFTESDTLLFASQAQGAGVGGGACHGG